MGAQEIQEVLNGNIGELLIFDTVINDSFTTHYSILTQQILPLSSVTISVFLWFL